ncbi:MAG: hypothetical protein MO846_11775 [Candidatus Devosia symbiotica]|nr:hypothetical protein [Candidatus Devosia symbiotica]
MSVAVFIAFKMKRDSSDLLRGQLELHRERQRAIKGDYTKKRLNSPQRSNDRRQTIGS